MGCIHSVDRNKHDTNKLKWSRKKDQEDSQIEVTAGIASGGDAAKENKADANDVPSPSIFKLDIDCCEEVFSFLPLVDLHSLGQTCKRMHQFTGYFVRENFKSTNFHWWNGNLYFNESKMNGFIEFIPNLQISSDQLKSFAEYAPRFKSVRKLCLYLGRGQIKCIREILHKCEEIEIRFDKNVLNIDLYKKILKFCTNLKHFKLISANFGNDELKNNNWLLHEYPNLESLDLYSGARSSIDEIKVFFTLNKGIRKFQTNFMCFWDCRHWIFDTDIKLDELLINCERTLNREHINLLNTLYERGFYKHLSLLKLLLYDSSILAEFRAPLTMEIYTIGSPLPPLDLKKTIIMFTENIDLETFLANNVLTIEQFYVSKLNAKSVLFLVQKFLKLREIRILNLIDVNPLNLAQLNEERKKLVGASRVTIYLNKRDYNATINTTDCELVKIKKY